MRVHVPSAWTGDLGCSWTSPGLGVELGDVDLTLPSTELSTTLGESFYSWIQWATISVSGL